LRPLDITQAHILRTRPQTNSLLYVSDDLLHARVNFLLEFAGGEIAVD
jgi:hypothetical protein